MATCLLRLVTLAFAILLFLPNSILSQTCKSQTFTNNNFYTNCLDLPTLSSFLHYTYDPSNSTLSIVFIATPSSSSGWISWAINPTSTGMLGSQALIAFKDDTAGNKLVVNTYNVTSYVEVSKGEIAYETWDRVGEEVGGVMRLYAKLKVGSEEVKKGLYQVWQVGGSVKGGVPQKHDLKDGNLNSKGFLDLVSGGTGGNSTGGGSSSGGGGGSRTKKRNVS